MHHDAVSILHDDVSSGKISLSCESVTESRRLHQPSLTSIDMYSPNPIHVFPILTSLQLPYFVILTVISDSSETSFSTYKMRIQASNPDFHDISSVQINVLDYLFPSLKNTNVTKSGIYDWPCASFDVKHTGSNKSRKTPLSGLCTVSAYILSIIRRFPHQRFRNFNSYITLFFLLILLNPFSVSTSGLVEPSARKQLHNSSDFMPSGRINTSQLVKELGRTSDSLFPVPDPEKMPVADEDIELSDDLPNLFSLDGSADEKEVELSKNDFAEGFENQQETIHLKKSDFDSTYLQGLVMSGQANAFNDGRHLDFTHMIYLDHRNFLYAVAEEATIVKLDGGSLALQESYTVPSRSQNSPYCDPELGCRQFKEINLLAMMPEQDFIWYCALHYERYPNGRIVQQQSITGCAVPQPNNLAENLLQWDNPYYTSFDPDHPPVVVNTQEPFSYFAALSSGHLRIMRTNMPDWNGEINWNGALFSPSRGVYIQEPAKILLGFETDNAVYFLIRERSSRQDSFCRGVGNFYGAGSTSGSDNEFQISNRAVARVVRVCKGDRGGLPRISASTFGTLAKADLVCHSEALVDGHLKKRFTFSYLQSAYWDASSKRLYTVFSTDVAGPDGSAVCIFDKSGLERAFNGPVVSSVSSVENPRPEPRENPFPDICERFSSGNLTESEISAGQIGASYLRRHLPILPLFGHAVSMVSDVIWRNVIGYTFSMTNEAHPIVNTILWLGTDESLFQIVLHEEAEVQNVKSAIGSPKLLGTCPLRIIHVNEISESSLHDSLNIKDELKPILKSSVGKNIFEEKNKGNKSDRNTLSSSEEKISNIIMRDNAIFIATKQSIYRLPIQSCGFYRTEDTCLDLGDPHCGWQSKTRKCIHLRDGTDITTEKKLADGKNMKKSRCRPYRAAKLRFDGGWSSWKPCKFMAPQQITSDRTSTEGAPINGCLCRICMKEDFCKIGEQEVSQCFEPIISPLANSGMINANSKETHGLHSVFIGCTFFVLGIITTVSLTCLLYYVCLRRRRCKAQKRKRNKVLQDFITTSAIENRLRTALLGSSFLSMRQSYVDMPQHVAKFSNEPPFRIPPLFPNSQMTNISSSNEDDTANQYDRLDDGSLSQT